MLGVPIKGDVLISWVVLYTSLCTCSWGRFLIKGDVLISGVAEVVHAWCPD